MVLSFNPKFKQPILDGKKIHTIRQDKTDRWKVGNSIQMSTDVRTPQQNCFANASCLSTQTILIERTDDDLAKTKVFVDGRELTLQETQVLAFNDGFENLAAFWLWFSEGFEGKIIHWTTHKY